MRSSNVLAAATVAAVPFAAASSAPAYASDGSEAFSLGTAWDVAKDGYNAYEAVKGAYDAYKNDHKREVPQPSGSEAISLGTVWDIGKDGYNAYEALKGAYDSWKSSHKRDTEFVELLAREIQNQIDHEHAPAQPGLSPDVHPHERGHGQGRFRHTKGRGRKGRKSGKGRNGGLHHTSSRVPGHESGTHRPAEQTHEATHAPVEHSASVPTAHAQEATQAYAQHKARNWVNTVEDGIHVVNDGANAVDAVHNAYESWKQSHRRGWAGDIEEGITIVNDAANAAESVHTAYESWKQSHRRAPEAFGYQQPLGYKWHGAIARALLNELD